MAKRNKTNKLHGVIAAVAGFFVVAVLAGVAIYFASGSDNSDSEVLPVLMLTKIEASPEEDLHVPAAAVMPVVSSSFYEISYYNHTYNEWFDKVTAVDSDNPFDENRKVAYLTFDDGPARSITPLILDILKEEGIKATFFILPREGFDNIFRRMINEGHEIGNHSYSHNYNALYKRGIDTFKNDILKAKDFMEENFGYTMTSFRFPGGIGSCGPGRRPERIEFIEELGYVWFDWDIDSGDAYGEQLDKSARALTANVLNGTGGKEHVVILMHDHRWRETTLEALPYIINGLREQGYRFDILRNHPDHNNG